MSLWFVGGNAQKVFRHKNRKDKIMNINRPWPTCGFAWILALVAFLIEVLLLCGIPVPHGVMIPLILTTLAILV